MAAGASGEGIFLPIGVTDQLTAPMQKMARAVAELNSALQAMSKKGKQAAEDSKKNEKNATGWAAALRKVRDGLKGIRDFNLKNAINDIREMSVLGLALGEGFREGLRTSMQFERSMIRLKYSGAITKMELGELRKGTVDLARDSEFSRNAFLESSLTLKNLGVSAKTALELAGKSSGFASTNQLELAAAVSQSAKISKLYYGDVTKISDAQDIMTVAAAKTNIPIHSLMDTLQGLGPIAGRSGTSLVQMASMLTVMSQAGMDAEDANMAVRMSMMKAASAGIPYGKALELVRDRYQKARTQAEKMQVLSVNFGPRALKLANYFEASSKKLDDLSESYRHAHKEAAEMNAEIEELPEQKIARVKNQLSETFATLAGPLANVLGFAAKITGEIGKIPGVLETVIVGFTALAASSMLGGAITGLTKIGAILFKIAPGLMKFAGVFGAVASKVSLVASALYGAWKIGQLLLLSFQALGEYKSKQGDDFLTPYARKRRDQQAGAAAAQPGMKPGGPGVAGALSNITNHQGMTISGDVNIHIQAKDAAEKDGLVGNLKKQMRARGAS